MGVGCMQSYTMSKPSRINMRQFQLEIEARIRPSRKILHRRAATERRTDSLLQTALATVVPQLARLVPRIIGLLTLGIAS